MTSSRPSDIKADVDKLFDDLIDLEGETVYVEVIHMSYKGRPPRAVVDEYRQLLQPIVDATVSVSNIEEMTAGSSSASIRSRMKEIRELIAELNNEAAMICSWPFGSDGDNITTPPEPTMPSSMRPHRVNSV